MDNPFFSVIIPSYNRYNRLIQAIESVLSQSFRDFELIVIDDGSTDNTPEIKDIFNGKIKYFRQENSGVSSARNKGISSANGMYIAFLDSDDLWLPSKLQVQADYIKKNPEILIHQTDETWIRNGVRVNPMKKHAKRDGSIFISSLELCLVSPSAVVIHKCLFDKYGLFDEDMPVCEDYDMWLRISAHEKIGLIPDQLIIKQGGHEDQLSRKFNSMDRFRIYSILKFLESSGETLKSEYRNAAVESLLRKCSILKNGAIKRGNSVLIETLENITSDISKTSYSRINYRNLLKI
jgi:glycosyltransferase involved in cell wall biosynthesis